MLRHLRASYNPWFIFPFLVWVLCGAGLLMTFDRRVLFATVNMNHTPLLDVVMYWLSKIGETGVPIILVSLLVFKSCRNWWYILAAAVCNGLPALLIQVLKSWFDEDRPFEWFANQKIAIDWIHFDPTWGDKLYHHSFPSGHSAGIFSLCCFLSMILPKRYTWMGVLLFILALAVGYTRMYLAAHFYADVFVGSIVGTTATLFCFAMMCRISNRSFIIVNHQDQRSTLI